MNFNQFLSSSHDDTILIWDFLNADKDGNNDPANNDVRLLSHDKNHAPQKIEIYF